MILGLYRRFWSGLQKSKIRVCKIGGNLPATDQLLRGKNVSDLTSTFIPFGDINTASALFLLL